MGDSTNNTSTSFSDTNSINTLPYFNSNASIISYDSVLTNERILDKLDLSQEDELLLQNFLNEQKEEKKIDKRSNDSRILCVPASQFPSLRIKQLQEAAANANNNFHDPIRQLLENEFTLKDKSLAAQVEQHYASTSRYSYIVEEDTNDLFDNVKDKFDNRTNNENNNNKININNKNYNRNQDIAPTKFNNSLKAPLQLNRGAPINFQNNSNNRYLKNSSHLSSINHDNIPNFESYRLENTKLSKLNSQMFNYPNNNIKANNNYSNNRMQYRYPNQNNQYVYNNNHHRENQEKSNFPNHSTKNIQQLNKTNSLSPANTVSRNASASSESEPPSVILYKVRTPMTSTSSDNINVATTPKKISGNDDPVNSSKSTLERPSVQHSHKKKSSLTSFKNLFKTPKKSKKTHNKEDSVGKLVSKSENTNRVKEFSNEHNNSSPELTPSNSSVENSPSLNRSNLRRFIFPPNPSFHFDAKKNNNNKNDDNTVYKKQHYRSLSDMHKPNVPMQTMGITSLQASPATFKTHQHNMSIQSDDSTLHLDYTNIIDLANKKNSSDLANVKLVPSDTFANDNKINQNSPISLSKSLKDNILQNPSEETSVQTDFTSKETQTFNNLIASAIDMRNEGKLEASALKLKMACESGNKTAYLLYGLSLRHGCGTSQDQVLSLSYIKKATGITSFEDEVYNCNIDPFDLEEKNCIPVKLQEPLVPALHECGISYLKAFGVKEVDEYRGLKFLEKAAFLGHVDSMCLCGIIWSQKSHNRKKDIARAAAWFRLADKRGANLIGSQWIYKKKYLKRRLDQIENM